METNIDGSAEQLETNSSESTDCLQSVSLSNNDLMPSNGKRKRKVASQNVLCPVCGLTLRFREIKEHYEKEIKSLEDLSDPSSKSSIKWQKRQQTKKTKKQNATTPENEDDEEEEKRKENLGKRLKEFSEVKDGRRMRYAKVLVGKWFSTGDEDPQAYQLTKCVVCDTPVAGNEEELINHVQLCLKKKEGDCESEEESGSESFDEYTWAGQTRIRATSLLEPGVYACDGEPVKLETTNEDEELDIESDGQTAFGVSQYTENDVIPCSSEIPEENEALDRIRAAISLNEKGAGSSDNSTPSRWTNEDDNCDGKTENDINFNLDIEDNDDSSTTISSLKSKILALNDELQREKLKCLICMEGFNTPLVSVICWHVYCEECWLRALGAKKLCPQCSTITSPADLRKIYIS